LAISGRLLGKESCKEHHHYLSPQKSITVLLTSFLMFTTILIRFEFRSRCGGPLPFYRTGRNYKHRRNPLSSAFSFSHCLHNQSTQLTSKKPNTLLSNTNLQPFASHTNMSFKPFPSIKRTTQSVPFDLQLDFPPTNRRSSLQSLPNELLAGIFSSLIPAEICVKQIKILCNNGSEQQETLVTYPKLNPLNFMASNSLFYHIVRQHPT
jgi:hypothetical protein